MKIISIKSRKHMIEDRENAERVCYTKNFILFICRTPERNAIKSKRYRSTDFVRVGVVVTKKIHKNAVIRNLFRRRLKEGFRLSNNDLFKNKYDYEIIARQAIFNCKLEDIINDLEKCLKNENNTINN